MRLTLAKKVESPKIRFETKTKKINSRNYCEVTIRDNIKGLMKVLSKMLLSHTKHPKKMAKDSG